MSRRLLLLLTLGCGLACGLAACGQDTPPPTVEVRLVTADGGNPLDRGLFDRVTVEVEQIGRPTTTVTRDLDGELDLGVEFDSLGGAMTLRVRFEGGGATLVGESPEFVPASAGGLVRVMMGAPGSCERASDAILRAPRSAAAIVRNDTFVTRFAGLEGGPSARVEFVDLLRWRAGELDDLTLGAGPAAGASLAAGESVVASAEGGFRYDLADSEVRERPLELHAGAGPGSVVVATEGGVAILGGELDGAPVGAVTWVAADGGVHQTRAAPRRGGAAIAIGDAVLVAGGEGEGMVAELLRPTEAEGTPIGDDDGVRRDPVLVQTLVGDATAAWLVGGVDAEGAPRLDHVALLGCPGACRAEPATDPAVELVGPSALGDTVVAGAQVLQARFDGRWSFEQTHTLATPRQRAGLVRFGDEGPLVVVAGDDRADVEVCW